MRGTFIAFITALLTFLAVALEGYAEYEKNHRVIAVRPAPGLQQPQASVTPIYWHDGRTWWCQVGDQKYFWGPSQPPAPDTRRIAWAQPNTNSNIR